MSPAASFARRRSIRATPAVGYWVRVRIYVAAGVLSVLFALIGYRAYDLQVVRADHFREAARRQHLRTVEVAAPRGAILDATGFELAATADVDSVFANPREVVDVIATAERLSDLLGVDVRTLESRLSSSRYFVWIKRRVSSAEAAAVKAADLAGVGLTPEPRRFYPAQSLAAPVLGFANIDGRGIEGVELSMDELLAGDRIELRGVRDATGKLMLAGGVGDLAEGAGATIQLTLDRFVQLATERALARAVEEHSAAAGTAVVLDVRDGRILAMASVPTYDPNEPSTRVGIPARNRAITDTFEAGSVMKVFTIAAALETGTVSPDDVIDVEKGRWRVGRKVFRDTHRDEQLSVGGILKRSSNVGSIKIAFALGKEKLHRALTDYGFGAATGVELPGEQTGILRGPSRWGQLGLATAAIGYGLTVTPVQLAAALAAVGNGGVLHPPRLIERVTGASGEVVYQLEPRGRRVMKAETSAALLPMLASVFDKGVRDGGTARTVDIQGFRAGGKTGTSHKVNPHTGKYYDEEEGRYLSTFIGLAPIEQPRIAVAVVIDEPRGEHHYGGLVAGPVFGSIVEDSLRYLGVPGSPPVADGDDSDRKAAAGDRPTADVPAAVEPPPPVVNATQLTFETAGLAGEGVPEVPDFARMGIGAALALARERGIELSIEGSGRAIAQQPQAGSRANAVRVVFSPSQ